MMVLLLLYLQLLQFSPPAHGTSRPLPGLDEFLKQVRAHLRSDRLLLSQYTYTQKQTENQFDKNGNLKKTTVRVYEVYPSPEEGQTYMRLISKDGKPLSGRELDKQDREHDEKMRKRARKLEREGAEERANRLAKEAEVRRKEDEVIDELFELYRISMTGRRVFDGHPAIELAFEPRSGYKPKSKDAGILKKFAGKALISEKDYELIDVQAQLIDTLSFGLGVLARLKKGASAEFRRRRVNDEVWLPAEARFSGSARVLLFKGLHLEAIGEFSDYKKFTVSTSVAFPERKGR